MLPESSFGSIVSVILVQLLLRFSSINFFLLEWNTCFAYCTSYFHYIYLLPLTLMIIGKLPKPKRPVRRPDGQKHPMLVEVVFERGFDYIMALSKNKLVF